MPTRFNKLFDLYAQMQRIRRIEEMLAARYKEWKMRCPMHLSIGQEAIAVGVCQALEKTDLVFSNHRGHAHYLAKGGDLNALVAEIYGKETGCCGGRGGSMHLIDQETGFVASTPIVGGTVPLSVGAAWSSKLQGKNSIAVIFLGDGCFEEGVVHESINFAGLHQLPILFVLENNHYSVYTPLSERQSKHKIVDIVAAYGIQTWQGNGGEVMTVAMIAEQAIDKIKQSAGPQFIEYTTYRWLEHCGPNYDDDLGYRPEGELENWQRLCPIKQALSNLKQMQLDDNIVSYELESRLKQTKLYIETEIEAAFNFAEQSPTPHQDSMSQHIYAPHHEPTSILNHKLSDILESKADAKGVRKITYAIAINEALHQCMAKDPQVILIGEGVPDPKGIFGTTSGLREKFGHQRVFDMPVAENGLTGVCIGAALTGMRPVMVHQRIDFAILALDQLINNAAKWHYMFNGKISIPLVVRLIIGRGWGQGPQHSQSLQALFAHIPGLKVVMPTTAYDAKGMLISAIEDDNPVIFIEHRWVHGIQDEVPEQSYRIPLDKARCVRQGNSVTIVAFSYMVIEALRVAEHLKLHGVEVEVIDMRSARPLDMPMVIGSITKTKHLMVLDTGCKTGGIGAEILAQVMEQAFDTLRAPPLRISNPDHPVPTSHFLADTYYPEAPEIASQLLRLIGMDEFQIGPMIEGLARPAPFDVPDNSFTGPF